MCRKVYYMEKRVNSSCYECNHVAEFRCTVCSKLTCGNHTLVRTVCPGCLGSQSRNYSIRQAYCEDVELLKELVLRFWGDLEQLMFGKRYIVTDAPALVAIYNNEILGFIFYTIFDEEAALIVALGVRPEYQGRGVGQALVKAVEEYARQEQKRQLLVVTSNDNIPALTFYQCQGFQLFEVVPDVIEEKLGGRVLGVNKIPIRDELRFRKALD